MFVYAKDIADGTLSCITMEECKATPWRWKFVKVSPGQENIVEEEKKEPVMSKNITTKKGIAKK